MRSVQLLILCTLLVSFDSLADATIIATRDGPEVGTLNGVLRGTWEISRATKSHPGRQFSCFRGIPYAEPPQRFQSPQPPKNWTGIRNATLAGNICPQTQTNATQNGSVTMGEDCLFLNVYTPRIIITNPGILQTMVYVHGGAFIEGAGSRMGPSYLMAQDIILVTLNYRLGALGFLSTGNGDDADDDDDMAIPGNMGLKDMIMALKWVKGNIGRFGGDPSRVTIFGESAGAAAVHAMMISPAAKNLFARVIAQSGSTLCPWAFQNDPKSVATKFATELGCTANKSSSDIVSCIKGKSLEDILHAQERTASMFFISPFVLTVDKFARDPVLPDTPRNLMDNPGNNSAGLPLIIGWNEKEGTPFAAAIIMDPATNQDFSQNWAEKIPQLLGYYDKDGDGDSVKNQNRITNAITSFYFNNTNTNTSVNNGPPVLSMSNLGRFSNLVTDAFFVSGIRIAALLHATYNEKVFTYELTYQGNFSLVNALGLPSSEGPCHADDLRYLFNITDRQSTVPASADEIFSENMTQLWTSFAREAEPISWDKNGQWLPIKSSQLSSSEGNTTSFSTPVSWFNLNKDPRLVPENQDLRSRMEFWENVFIDSESSAGVGGGVSFVVICSFALIHWFFALVVMEIRYY